MKKIKYVFLAASLASALTLGAVAASTLFSGDGIFMNDASTDTPTINFTSSKNRFSGSGSSSANTELGTEISFTHTTLTLPSEGWGTLDTGAYFFNTVKITDLISLSVTSSSGGSVGVYWSETAFTAEFDPAAAVTDYEIHAFTEGSTSSYTYYFDGGHPDYLYVHNEGDASVTISNMVLVFACSDQYKTVTVTATSENADAGTVIGGSNYVPGETVTLSAVSNSGYRFSGWYSGDTQVSTSATYAFEATESVSLIAKFAAYEEAYVNAVTGTLPSDFAYGMDMSEVYELEALGANYTDKDGNAFDVFEIIKSAGCNYVRFRLWVNPFSSVTGASYGGGSNDIDVDIAMAKRAEAAGLSIMIDYHMSDTYTEPGRQYAPKSWQSSGTSQYPTLAASFVTETMTKFKNAGVTVDSFQIGNETTTRIADQYFNDSSGIANEIVAEGIKAGKAVFPDAESICHITAAKSSGYYTNWLTYIGNINTLLSSTGYKVDILGFSYYPYYHGAASGLSDLEEQLTAVTSKYPDMRVMVLETAWGYTDDWTDDTNNTYWTYKTDSSCNVADCGYDTSVQAQATEMWDVMNVLSKYGDQGAGIFYWGADWYPVAGTKWVSETGYYYINVGKGTSDAPEGTDLSTYTSSCKASWANQALFDYSGQALPSLYTYGHHQKLDNTLETDVIVSPYYGTGALEYTCGLDEIESTLETSITCATKLGRKVDGTVTWDTSKVTADGEYTITGTVTGTLNSTTYTGTISATLKVESNVLTDGGFESQTDGSAITNSTSSPWDLTQSVTGAVVASSEAVNSGSLAAKFWYSGTYTFDLSQTVTITDTGYYEFSLYANGYTDYTNPGYLYYSRNSGDNVTQTGFLQNTTSDFTLYTFSDIYAEEGDTLKVGVYASCTSSSWGHIDDAALKETMPIGLKDGSFDNQTASSTTGIVATTSPWTLEGEGFSVAADYDHARIEENWKGWPHNSGTSTGNNVFDYYTKSNESTFTLSQTFNALAGTYSLSFYGTSDASTDFTITLVSGSTTLATDTFSGSEIPWTTSDAVGTLRTISDIVVSSTSSITLSIAGKCAAGAWGRLDEFTFAAASSTDTSSSAS